MSKTFKLLWTQVLVSYSSIVDIELCKIDLSSMFEQWTEIWGIISTQLVPHMKIAFIKTTKPHYTSCTFNLL